MTFRNYCQVSVTVCHKYHLSFRRCTKQNSITKATNGRSFQLTPLFLACWAKKPEAALILLEEGADPNILALQTFTGGEQVEMSPLYAAEGPKMDEVETKNTIGDGGKVRTLLEWPVELLSKMWTG